MTAAATTTGSRTAIIYVGPTGTRAVIGGIATVLTRTGGVQGPLGYPTSNLHSTAGGIGVFQLFQGGSVWFSWSTGAHFLRGAISTRYRDFGGPDSELGFPTTDTAASAGGAFNHFERGGIYSKSGAGTHVLTGTMYNKYRGAIGETEGDLGYPTTDRVAQGPGYRVTFEQGEIAYRPDRSLAEVHGRIVTKWRSKGGYGGPLGWPIKDTEVLPDGVGRRSRFDSGTVYTRGAAGVWEVHGPIHFRYLQLGETTGSLGYPRSDIYAVGGNFRCDFQHGSLTYDPDSGDVTGP